jgi:hypothetical protein
MASLPPERAATATLHKGKGLEKISGNKRTNIDLSQPQRKRV